jgi:hypothetical protein
MDGLVRTGGPRLRRASPESRRNLEGAALLARFSEKWAFPPRGRETPGYGTNPCKNKYALVGTRYACLFDPVARPAVGVSGGWSVTIRTATRVPAAGIPKRSENANAPIRPLRRVTAVGSQGVRSGSG